MADRFPGWGGALACRLALDRLVVVMKVIVESLKTKKRAVFADGESIGAAVVAWIKREEAAGRSCGQITVTLHLDGENCDHEHPEVK